MAMSGANQNTILEIENLYLSFGGVKVLNGINLSVPRGVIFSIIGPNGAGKTSLINCINMHYRPDHGGIRFDGKALNGIKPHAVAALGPSEGGAVSWHDRTGQHQTGSALSHEVLPPGEFFATSKHRS